tara:strand:+ start:1009 stop:1206 length:198 start_codon:yes stop_codon:yes gene_type:complete
MTQEHINDKLKLQIAINALLELRSEAQSGSYEMCTIDATLGNLGVPREYLTSAERGILRKYNVFE